MVSTSDVLEDLQVHGQAQINRAFLLREFVMHEEINDQAAAARRLLGSAPLSIRADLAALAANAFPFELRRLDRMTQVSREKVAKCFEPLVRLLFRSLSSVKLRHAPEVLVDETLDELNTSLGILGHASMVVTIPPQSRYQVVSRAELALRCHDDVEAALRLVASGEPGEEAVLLLTALILEMIGEMEPPPPDAGDADTTRIERVRKAVRRARKRRAILDRQATA